MRLSPILGSWLGILFILAGVLLGLAVSASSMWGNIEATLYTSYNGDQNLHLQCPFMLSPNETGTIRANITNITNEDVTPTVSAEISHADTPRHADQIVSLKPNGSETLTWSVNPSDVVYKYLILVNILQLRYSDNPSRLGSCGIVLFSLFGLSGFASFALIIAVSLVAMLLGAILWLKAHQPLNERSRNLGRSGRALMLITVLALLSLFPRWWGLTLVLDALILLILGVIFTDFLIVPQNQV
jgi:hypothetical protein